MSSQFEKVPVVQLRYDSAFVYEQYLTPCKFNRDPNEENLIRDDSYNGYLSPKTKSKIKKILTTWINSFRENIKEIKKVKKNAYMGFLTLTLGNVKGQHHDDNFVKRNLLTRFVEDLKRLHGLEHYFWRAEPQKNGKIHFHLFIDVFICKYQITLLWNKYLLKYGYLDESKLSDIEIEDVNNVKHKGKFGTSTNIKNLGNVKDVCSYVIKYCTKMPKKNEKGDLEFYDQETGKKEVKFYDLDGVSELKAERKIKGRLWGTSDGIKKMQPYSEYLNPTDEELKKLIEEYDCEDLTDGVVMVKGFKLWKCKKLIPKLYKRAKEFYNQQVIELYTGCDLLEPDPIFDKNLIIEEAKKEKLYEPKQLALDLRIYERWERIGIM